jgi:excisionase family DNA binding protein
MPDTLTPPRPARTARSTDHSLTTGQAARALDVSNRTLQKYVDAGLISGWTLPGSNDRRVRRADLIAFAVRHGVPLPPEFGAPCLSVLVVGGPGLAGVKAALDRPVSADRAGIACQAAPDVWLAAALLRAASFAALVVDAAGCAGLGVPFLRAARPMLGPAPAVAWVEACGGDWSAWLDAGCAAVVERPAGAGEVARAVRAALGEVA